MQNALPNSLQVKVNNLNHSFLFIYISNDKGGIP